jgi:hypothetical protein
MTDQVVVVVMVPQTGVLAVEACVTRGRPFSKVSTTTTIDNPPTNAALISKRFILPPSGLSVCEDTLSGSIFR